MSEPNEAQRQQARELVTTTLPGLVETPNSFAAIVAAIASALAEKEEQLDTALRFIDAEGYRRCDIPACNCPFWHGGNASTRLREISDELGDHNGLTILEAVKQLRTRTLEEAARIAREKDADAMFADDENVRTLISNAILAEI